MAARAARKVDKVCMREPALRTQSRVGRGDGREQVAIAHAAFDQHRYLALACDLGGARSRRSWIVVGIDDRQARDVEPRFGGGIANPAFGAHQNRRQVAGKRPRKRELKRIAVARMHDRRRKRRAHPDFLDKALKLRAHGHGARRVASRHGLVNTSPIGGRPQGTPVRPAAAPDPGRSPRFPSL